MAAYPLYTPSPNGYQIIGQALTDASKQLTDFSERQARLKQQIEEMTQRRAAAILAQKLAEEESKRKDAEDRRQEEDEKRKADADKRANDFAIAVAKGKTLSETLSRDPSLSTRPPAGDPSQPSEDDLAYLSDLSGSLPSQRVRAGMDATAMMGEALERRPTEAGNGRVPFNRDEILDLAMQYRQMDPKGYMEATKAEKSRIQVQEIGGRKVRVDLDSGEITDLGPARPQRDRFTINEIGGRKVRVNLDSGEMTDLGPITTKPLNPKDRATVNGKITMLTLAKSQLDDVQKRFNDIKGTFSAGVAGQGHAPTPSGKAFDAAVNAMRNTITGLTRVPGVGAMSDFETKLSQAGNPSRTEYEDVTQQQIDQLYQLINTLDDGYQKLLPDIEGDPTEDTNRPPIDTPVIPARGRFRSIDVKTAADYLNRAGGDRKKAKAMLAKDGYNVGN